MDDYFSHLEKFPAERSCLRHPKSPKMRNSPSEGFLYTSPSKGCFSLISAHFMQKATKLIGSFCFLPNRSDSTRQHLR